MHNVSIFGTSSDAGKSTITFVIAKIIQDLGYSVAPFKAQNVSNNAVVADDGSEIAIAQHFQASVVGVKTSWHNNPILLKSGRKNLATLVVAGKVVSSTDVHAYYRELDLLKPTVDRAFNYLDKHYDCVVAEGAGSPVELNLMQKDLSNIYIATQFKTKIILVADIEKGGVFASIYGVYHLLPEHLRKNVIGVIVNKFRGDLSLFDEGIEIIENDFGIPVLGVLPYKPFNLGFEDAQSLLNFTQDCSHARRKVAVINYPTMSNYNDFEPLLANKMICLEFIASNINLSAYDCVILPGSKKVIEDLQWLKESGLFEQLKKLKVAGVVEIVGISGGYEMMFMHIIDDACIETDVVTKVEGLGFINDNIVFQEEKILKQNGALFEIHHGTSEKYPLEYRDKNLFGTFSHGLFVDEWFKSHSHETIENFVATMRKRLDVEKIMQNLL